MIRGRNPLNGQERRSATPFLQESEGRHPENCPLCAGAPRDYLRRIDGLFLPRDEIVGFLSSRVFPSDQNAEYRVAVEYRDSHRYGDGGEYEERVIVHYGTTVVLISICHFQYETSQDDSCDYDTRVHKSTYVIAENKRLTEALKH